jgi:hypothetical protein
VFDLNEFHSSAWEDWFAAAEAAKQTVEGASHLQMSCNECAWIGTFALRRLIGSAVTVG